MITTAMRILIVEDEPKVAAFLKKGLEEESYEVEIAYDGEVAQQLLSQNTYDFILLDVNLPHVNGFALCRHIRSYDPHVPIIMLTALGTTDDVVHGLDSGADDYLPKPFRFQELTARIRALSRRKTLPTAAVTVLNYADLEMNLLTKQVKRGNKEIILTPREFALLEYFLRNKEQVLTRTAIGEEVWDLHFDPGTNVIDVYVNYLRKKIDKEFPTKLIHTVFGMGYIMREEA